MMSPMDLNNKVKDILAKVFPKEGDERIKTASDKILNALNEVSYTNGYHPQHQHHAAAAAAAAAAMGHRFPGHHAAAMGLGYPHPSVVAAHLGNGHPMNAAALEEIQHMSMMYSNGMHNHHVRNRGNNIIVGDDGAGVGNDQGDETMERENNDDDDDDEQQLEEDDGRGKKNPKKLRPPPRSMSAPAMGGANKRRKLSTKSGSTGTTTTTMSTSRMRHSDHERIPTSGLQRQSSLPVTKSAPKLVVNTNCGSGNGNEYRTPPMSSSSSRKEPENDTPNVECASPMTIEAQLRHLERHHEQQQQQHQQQQHQLHHRNDNNNNVQTYATGSRNDGVDLGGVNCNVVEEADDEEDDDNILNFSNAKKRVVASSGRIRQVHNSSAAGSSVSSGSSSSSTSKTTTTAKAKLELNNKKKSPKPARWTPEQDDMLRNAVAIYGPKSWKSVAALVEGRDHVQCLQRWNKVLQPGLIKGPWTPEEDTLLKELIQREKMENWSSVAQRIPGRTAKQCRERWRLNLDPNINREPFTKEEDELLLKLHAERGNKWAEIKQKFVGRTENSVKTRLKSLMRSKAREWTAEQDQELLDLAHKHGQDWEHIASLIGNRTPTAVKTRYRKLTQAKSENESGADNKRTPTSRRNSAASSVNGSKNGSPTSKSSSTSRVSKTGKSKTSSAATSSSTTATTKSGKGRTPKNGDKNSTAAAAATTTTKSKRGRKPKKVKEAEERERQRLLLEQQELDVEEDASHHHKQGRFKKEHLPIVSELSSSSPRGGLAVPPLSPVRLDMHGFPGRRSSGRSTTYIDLDHSSDNNSGKDQPSSNSSSSGMNEDETQADEPVYDQIVDPSGFVFHPRGVNSSSSSTGGGAGGFDGLNFADFEPLTERGFPNSPPRSGRTSLDGSSAADDPSYVDPYGYSLFAHRSSTKGGGGGAFDFPQGGAGDQFPGDDQYETRMTGMTPPLGGSASTRNVNDVFDARQHDPLDPLNAIF